MFTAAQLKLERLVLCFILFASFQAGGLSRVQAQEAGQAPAVHWLSQSPPNFKPFAVKLRAGAVVIEDMEFGQRYFSLLRIAADPSVIDRNECAILPALLANEVLAPKLQKGGGCGSKNALRWLGADEFERGDVRQEVMGAFHADVKKWVPSLPQTVLIVDDVKLGEYDAASNAFPILGADAPPIQSFFPTWTKENMKQALQFDWPAWRLPVSGTDEARNLLKEVNSWDYAPLAGLKPQKGQRALRRAARIQIVGIDTKSQRMDIKLEGLALYDLELTKEIHRFEIASHAEPAIVGDIPAKFDVASPARLDRLHMNVKLLAASNGEVSDATWQDLTNDVIIRDQEYYGIIPALQPHTNAPAVRPFFAKGHFALPKEQRERLKAWATAYAAGMPEAFEHLRDYTYNEFVAGRTYKFSGVPDDSAGPDLKLVLEQGYPRERIIGYPGVQGLFLILPKAADAYGFEISGDDLMPFAGKRMYRRTLLKLGAEKLLRAAQGAPVLLVEATPVSARVEFEGSEIKTQSFD